MLYRKSIFILLIIVLLFMVGCSNNVMLDEENSNLLNYDFKIANEEKIDSILSNQKYAYSTNIDKKFIAVIIYESKNASIKQYLIANNDSLDLVIPKGSKFIISFPTNEIIVYTWNIKNKLENNIILFKNSSWIHMDAPSSEKDKEGVSYDRMNFYYDSINLGNQEILMRYESEEGDRKDFFEILFNISVE